MALPSAPPITPSQVATLAWLPPASPKLLPVAASMKATSRASLANSCAAVIFLNYWSTGLRGDDQIVALATWPLDVSRHAEVHGGAVVPPRRACALRYQSASSLAANQGPRHSRSWSIRPDPGRIADGHGDALVQTTTEPGMHIGGDILADCGMPMHVEPVGHAVGSANTTTSPVLPPSALQSATLPTFLFANRAILATIQ